jgi:hypothetical protein
MSFYDIDDDTRRIGDGLNAHAVDVVTQLDSSKNLAPVTADLIPSSCG